MCLVIDKSKHLFGTSRVTLKPIVVYKVLENPQPRIFKTPFRSKSIDFVNHECVLKSKFEKEELRLSDNHVITAGIHAYTNSLAAYFLKSQLSASLYAPNYVVVKAIIPKFANYFVGCDYDIVANKMIITDEIVDF